MILELLDEATDTGARLEKACEVLGITSRTIQRWKQEGVGTDRRAGPRQQPANALSETERRRVLDVVNRPAYRDLSPKQIVPKLAEQGIYIASESTIYRILRQEGQLTHRQPSRPPHKRHKPRLMATGPNQVWSWDITYLKTDVRGIFLYLYLVEDVYSRKIVAWCVETTESMDLSAALIEEACKELGVDPTTLVLHADNGGPMKGSTMLATLQRLGIVASFSRPCVSDDNPYSEALFRTLKYRPEYPRSPFTSPDQAARWVGRFVHWYNTEHLHSGINFVTPDDRHFGREHRLLAIRRDTYRRARQRHPERWTGPTRDWTPAGAVYINRETSETARKAAA